MNPGDMFSNKDVIARASFKVQNNFYDISLHTDEKYLLCVPQKQANFDESWRVTFDKQDIRNTITIPLSLVFGVTPICTKGQHNCQLYGFCLHFATRSTKHRWRKQKLKFLCEDRQQSDFWVQNIKQSLSTFASRPRRLLVFINPIGGRRRAANIYQRIARPLFACAGIHCDVIYTERRNHARDYLRDNDLSPYEGVVVIGGDGMFAEVLNGLLQNEMHKQGVASIGKDTPLHRPNLRIGIIPGGSTDTVVYSTVGINDPETSALQIILGDSIGIDVLSIFNESNFVRFAVSFLSYGWFGDVVLDSERYRWMGPRRYELSGVKKTLLNRSYPGAVWYLPCCSREHEYSTQTCLAGCPVCMSTSAEHGTTSKWQKLEGTFVAINSAGISCRNAKTPEGFSPGSHLGDGTVDLILVKRCSRLNYVKHLLSTQRRNMDPFKYEFVELLRVKAFSFRPPVCADEHHNWLAWEDSQLDLTLAESKSHRFSFRRNTNKKKDLEADDLRRIRLSTIHSLDGSTAARYADTEIRANTQNSTCVSGSLKPAIGNSARVDTLEAGDDIAPKTLASDSHIANPKSSPFHINSHQVLPLVVNYSDTSHGDFKSADLKPEQISLEPLAKDSDDNWRLANNTEGLHDNQEDHTKLQHVHTYNGSVVSPAAINNDDSDTEKGCNNNGTKVRTNSSGTGSFFPDTCDVAQSYPAPTPMKFFGRQIQKSISFTGFSDFSTGIDRSLPPKTCASATCSHPALPPRRSPLRDCQGNFRAKTCDRQLSEPATNSSATPLPIKFCRENSSVWNCDGEILDNPAIDVRVERQLIRLFARGVEPNLPEMKFFHKLFSCCSRTNFDDFSSNAYA